jgi:hypothetical protein
MKKDIRRTGNFLAACVAMAGLLLLFAPGLQARESRPSNVPTNYVTTPFGYFNPSCVHLVAEGDTLLPDGSLQHPDGSVDPASICNYPHYTSTGQLVPLDSKALAGTKPPEISGWLESVSVTTSESYGKINATWTVPPSPESNDGQILYFFPGLEDIDHVVSIVQPVLQWGDNGSFGGAYWTFASWNCCISNGAYVSTPIDVNVGDALLGVIDSNCKPGSESCVTWNIGGKDETTGHSTALQKSPADGQTWNWAFGAVSEDYDLVQCSDFPNDTSLTFTVTLYNQDLQVISNPSWSGTQWISNPDPACNYATQTSATQETVEY